MTTWKVQIDWDRDGTFTQSIDDITSYVIKANWFLGMRKPYEAAAHEMLMVLHLKNVDRRFSPDNAASPLYGKINPHVQVQVVANDGVNDQVMWTGWLQTINPSTGMFGERVVRFRCEGAVGFYSSTETQIELQEDKRSDEIVRSLIEEVAYPPQLNKTVILDVNATLRDGTNPLTLPNFNESMSLDEGQLTLSYAADNWVRQGGYSNRMQDSYDVYRAITDITSAERGKFFFNREGKAVFLNRGHFLRFYEPDAQVVQFDDTMQGLDYIYANPEQNKNDIVVIAHPRTISATNTEKLWELGDSVIKVKANDTHELYVKYEDENGCCKRGSLRISGVLSRAESVKFE